VAQIAVYRDDSLEQRGRISELTPSDMRDALSHRYNHLAPAIADGLRDGQGLLPESDGLVVVANGLAMVRQESEDPREPALIAELPCEHFRLVEVLCHTRSITERLERVPKSEVGVDGLFQSLTVPSTP
jgi:hypothetical protein